MSALKEDIDAEGNRQPRIITIKNYDSQSLSLHIADLISNRPRYQLARYNCSNVVAECLEIACNQAPSFKPSAKDYGKLGRLVGRGIWTPNEILRYAEELAAKDKALS